MINRSADTQLTVDRCNLEIRTKISGQHHQIELHY